MIRVSHQSVRAVRTIATRTEGDRPVPWVARTTRVDPASMPDGRKGAFMILRRLLQGLLVVCFLAAPSLARAATTSEVINGAACNPYPPYTSTSGVPYQHWLWFNQVAY